MSVLADWIRVNTRYTMAAAVGVTASFLNTTPVGVPGLGKGLQGYWGL